MDIIQKHYTVHLTPITAARVKEAAKKFRGKTGVGPDNLRPRHIAGLSGEACEALAWLLNQIEEAKRWPMVLRNVTMEARGKKTGGCRLTGVASTAYRIWAKIRFHDCKDIIEPRISRPYLAGAPGRGALDASFEIAWKGEYIAARGLDAAALMIDFQSYFDHITTDEYAVGAKAHGLPTVITSLNAHVYLGPRRISIQGAVSHKVWPRRSVLPGCTWAMLHVRFHVAEPAQEFLDDMKIWLAEYEISIWFNILVDDAAMMLWGGAVNLRKVIVRACQNLFAWVKDTLRKQVSMKKNQCIVSSRNLKDRIAKQMLPLKMPVMLYGEMLGVDCTAGGRISRRAIQHKRAATAFSRRSRISWWRRISGSAMWLVRSGPRAQGTYGSDVHGLSNVALRKLRAVHCAASRLSSAASSTTAKLAIGGHLHAEADPAVKDTGGPFFRTLEKLWDQHHARAEFVMMWKAAVDEITTSGENWNRIKGPVGAAILTVLRAGGQWSTPHQVELLGHTVQILETPPKQVQGIYKAQARRALDNDLITRTARDYDVEEQIATRRTYQYGIDWECVRQVLNENSLDGWGGDKGAKTALHTVVGRGFWPEERRWRAGKIGSSTCEACFEASGDDEHKVCHCEALQAQLIWKQLAGTYTPVRHDTMAQMPRPFRAYGWPPIVAPWKPIEEEVQHGDMHETWSGDSFGDGSGVHQEAKEARMATWAVIRQDLNGNVVSRVRGNITGWYPTVMRSEMMALAMHLRTSIIPARYIGDCLAVINGAKNGVDEELCSSRSLHADLWREIRRLQKDHGEGQTTQKTQAHRSRASAEGSADDPIQWWMGNSSADHYAKQLSTEIAAQDDTMAVIERQRSSYRRWLRHLGVAVQWHFSMWPETNRRVKRSTGKSTEEDGSECGEHRLQKKPLQGWRCSRCLREAWTRKGRRRLRCIPCDGDPSLTVHQSHSLHTTRGVLWCIKCGAHTKRMPVTLTKQCVGAPRSGAYRNVIKRMKAGRMPTEQQDREEDKVGKQCTKPWEQTVNYSNRKRAPSRGNGRTEQEKEAMDHRMAIKRRKLTLRCDPQQGTAQHLKRVRQQASEVVICKRRRVTDKTAVTKEACVIMASGKWIHRIKHSVDKRTAACSNCGRQSRTKCRACTRPLCIECARAKAPCGDSSRPVGTSDSQTNSPANDTGNTRRVAHQDERDGRQPQWDT